MQMQRPNGTIYTDPAAVGENVPGPMITVGEKIQPAPGWKYLSECSLWTLADMFSNDVRAMKEQPSKIQLVGEIAELS